MPRYIDAWGAVLHWAQERLRLESLLAVLPIEPEPYDRGEALPAVVLRCVDDRAVRAVGDVTVMSQVVFQVTVLDNGRSPAPLISRRMAVRQALTTQVALSTGARPTGTVVSCVHETDASLPHEGADGTLVQALVSVFRAHVAPLEADAFPNV